MADPEKVKALTDDKGDGCKVDADGVVANIPEVMKTQVFQIEVAHSCLRRPILEFAFPFPFLHSIL